MKSMHQLYLARKNKQGAILVISDKIVAAMKRINALQSEIALSTNELDLLTLELRMAMKELFPKEQSNQEKVVKVRCWSDVYLEEGDSLVTIKMARYEMNIVRTTLFNLRQQGLITTYEKGRSVRFKASEISAAKGWYSVLKGKL